MQPSHLLFTRRFPARLTAEQVAVLLNIHEYDIPILTRAGILTPPAASSASLLNGWLQQHGGMLPPALAMDGKMNRDHIGLLTLAQHEDGAPQAVAVYDQKENTPRCEQAAAAALLENLPALDGKIITDDPLHCQRAHARTIVEKGGEFLFQIKGNQPNLLQQAQGLDALKDTPFLPTATPDTAVCKPGACTPSISNRSPQTSPRRERWSWCAAIGRSRRPA